MSRLIIVFVLMALPAAATLDQVFAVSAVNGGSIANCNAMATGTTSAAVSFGCGIDGNSFSGKAGAELGLGAYGIGVSTTIQAAGFAGNPDSSIYAVESRVDFSWSQEFIITGAEGKGYVTPQLAGSFCAPTISGSTTLTFFGALCRPAGEWSLPGGGAGLAIPVTFDVPFTITLSGSLACSTINGLSNCGVYGRNMTAYVSDLIFSDARGNLLTGATLAAVVPEVPSFILLLTVVSVLFIPRARHMKRDMRL